jgi:hypothetical protein
MARNASFVLQIRLQGFYVFCCGSLGALLDFEAHALTLAQRLEANGLNGAVMNEHIAAFILFDEAKAFLLIEPLYFTF